MATVDYNYQTVDYVDEASLIETHDSHTCQYKTITKTIIIDRRTTVFVLVRVCKCPRYINKEHFLQKRVIQFHDFADGVELHIDNRCFYKKIRKPNGRLALKKMCYCPRDLYEQLEIN